MTTIRDNYHKSAIFETLNSLFFSLLDEARSSGLGSRPWPELIGLMALRFLAGDPAKADLWMNNTLEIPARGNASTFFRRVSEDIERANPELENVFTKALLSGIERIDSRVLDAWAFRLARLSLIGSDREAFGFWLDEQLADSAAQTPESGQYTTPPSVARLMVQLASLPSGASVLDPCCGIGEVLSAAVEWSRENHSPVGVFGQELLPVNWALSRLRLFGLGQDPGLIALGDSLRQPAFAENFHLRMFDCVLCDPPLGLTLHEPDLALRDTYERFIYSAPGRGHSDAAFVQHAAASTNPGGKSILLVSHGFLFRLGGDARVREGLIRTGRVQAVIGLPAKLRPSTAIESALIVLGENHTGEVLVVDASKLQLSARGRAQLSDESIAEIVQLVRSGGQGRPKIARRITEEELANSDFSLQPRRYVFAPGPQDDVLDPVALREELRAVDDTARNAVAEMDVLLEELID